MKEKFLFLVVAAIAFGCHNVKAESSTGSATVKMTYINNDANTTSYGEIAEGNTAIAGYNKISSGTVGWAYSSWGVNYVTYLQVDASALSENEYTITGATLTAQVSGSTDSKRATTWGVGYNSTAWSSEMTASTADLSITTVGSTYTTSTQSSTTFETATFDILNAFSSDEDNVVTILVYETVAGGGYIKNPAVTITYIEGSTATYTVKFVDESGNTLQDNAEATGAVGSSIDVSEYQADIWVDGAKYIYSSDDSEELTIAEDGSTVVTMTFRAANSYSYSLVASVDDYTIASGTTYEGESVTIPYSKYMNVDGTLYSANAYDNSYNTYSYTFTSSSDNQVETITYTATDITNVVFFSEVENIEGVTQSASNSYIRSSNCLAAYASSSDVTITTLAAGTYTIYAGTFNASSTDATFSITVGETTYSITATAKVNLGSANTTEFTITESTDVVLVSGVGGTYQGLDYIYIVGTESGSTAVESISQEKSVDDGAYYNLQGVKVLNPSRGIYIHNGKKVLVK